MVNKYVNLRGRDMFHRPVLGFMGSSISIMLIKYTEGLPLKYKVQVIECKLQLCEMFITVGDLKRRFFKFKKRFLLGLVFSDFYLSYRVI